MITSYNPDGAKTDSLSGGEYRMLIFFGIQDEKLFVQLTDRDDNIIYEAEAEIANRQPNTLFDALYELFPDEFDELDIKRPKLIFFQFDGQRVVESGTKKIADCDTVLDKYPRFGAMLFSFLPPHELREWEQCHS